MPDHNILIFVSFPTILIPVILLVLPSFSLVLERKIVLILLSKANSPFWCLILSSSPAFSRSLLCWNIQILMLCFFKLLTCSSLSSYPFNFFFSHPSIFIFYSFFTPLYPDLLLWKYSQLWLPVIFILPISVNILYLYLSWSFILSLIFLEDLNSHVFCDAILSWVSFNLY
jgi:hypothetical protein